jgi:hypothetical protein
MVREDLEMQALDSGQRGSLCDEVCLVREVLDGAGRLFHSFYDGKGEAGTIREEETSAYSVSNQ